MNWKAAAAALRLTPDEALALTHQKLAARYRLVIQHDHPDHGGNHNRAVEINTGRAVLRDWIKAGKPVEAPEPSPQPPPGPKPEPPPRPEPRPKPPPPRADPQPAQKPERGWKFGAREAGAVALMMVVVGLGIGFATPAPSVPQTVVQPAVHTITQPISEPTIFVNKCIYDNYGRCVRMVYDALKGNP